MSTIPIDSQRIKTIISNFKKTKIIVIGDIMIDEYMWGEVNRISPEAPVPVVEVEEVSYRLGGAANVVQNLRKLSASPLLISIVGSDDNGKKMRSMLSELECSGEFVYTSTERPTTIKTRIMAKQQQVVRADQESTSKLTDKELNSLLNIFENLVSQDDVGGVIISDYGKGVVCPIFLDKVVNRCRQKELYVAVDPKEKHFDRYKGVTVITPNLKEAHNALSLPFTGRISDEEIETLGWKLVDSLELTYLLLTLSERGMAIFERDGHVVNRLPTVAKKVFDVTGAGDTVISVFSAAMVRGATPIEAAYMANHAAGITIAELGTSSVTSEALLAASLKALGV